MKYALVPQDGPLLSSEADAVELLGALYGTDTDVLAIPVTRLAPEFWDLRTRKAGLFIQKFQNYRVRPAFVGDISAWLARSEALAAYVRECQRGRDVYFVESLPDLEALP